LDHDEHAPFSSLSTRSHSLPERGAEGWENAGGGWMAAWGAAMGASVPRWFECAMHAPRPLRLIRAHEEVIPSTRAFTRTCHGMMWLLR
jgi:hypothetical protein